MKTFNFNRFSQALKCQFLVLRKTWIRLFGIFTLVMFMADLFFTRVQGHNYQYMLEEWGAAYAYQRYNSYVEQTVGSSELCGNKLRHRKVFTENSMYN